MLQKIMFTACPYRRTEDGLGLSVRISPQLVPEGDPKKLATFPDWLDWPAAVEGAHWRVAVGGAAPVDAVVTSDGPRSDLWTRLFSSETPVRAEPYPDYTKHLWRSYPVGHIVDYIHDLYQSIATTHPTEHPPWQDLAALFEISHLDPGGGADLRPGLLQDLEVILRTHRAVPPGPPDPQMDFLQLWKFHQPGSLTELTPPDFDFHQVVGLCGDHFGLLRRLGLVVDLAVRGEFADGPTTVRVQPQWTSALGAGSTDILPVTHATLGPGSFLPRPQDPDEMVGGRLPLGGPRYRVFQVDADGGALNLMMLARNLIYAHLLHASEDTPDREPLPGLREGGIAVGRTGHASQLVERVDAGFDLDALRANNQEMHLHAEDLWHGTRIDVRDPITNQWHSLQRRVGDYRFLDPEEDHHELIGEEAAVVEVPTSRDDPDEPGAFEYLHMQETLVHWDGSSLAAPRPGRTLDEQDQVVEPPEEHPDGFPLIMSFKAEPRSLPRLRFGAARYFVRARAVDPAGNSAPFDQSTAQSVSLPYLRYEPVPPPFVLMTAPRTEGESDAHVVLRSEHDEPASDDVQRHIVPPRCAQRAAEQHGMYDTDDGKLDPSKATYDNIVAREAQSFADPAYGGGLGTPDPGNYDQPYFPAAPLPVLYLPDPMARGASLRFVPEIGDEVLVSFLEGDVWPQARPVRLVVAEGDGPPEVAELDDEAVVTVRLGKADQARIRLSSFLDPDVDLPRCAIWHLMLNSGQPEKIGGWRSLASEGRLWMITPWRDITLVHAVRRPLEPPAFQDEALHFHPREPGDTSVDLGGLLRFSHKSTGRLDLRATWHEIVDLGPGGGVDAEPPRLGDDMRPHTEWLDLPIAEVTGESGDFLTIARRQEFHDTKRRVVTYEAKATSKFTEYFQERERDVQVAPGEVVVLPETPIVEESDLVRRSGDGPSFERGQDYEIDYETGHLTWLDNEGAQVDIVYLPEPTSRMSEEAEQEAERAVTLDIPSTARPLAPKVLYAIPTHRWTHAVNQSVGKGGGLRLWLDRPFFETGVGQLLGVVCDPNPNAPDPDLASYATAWGFDPVEGPPAPPTSVPGPGHFPLAAQDGVGTGLVLDENGKAVNVAGHEVGFDEDRKLWFCDIEVDAGEAHMPFIRLALAGYQPNSVANLHLSRVTMADIVQLTPDRTVTIGPGGFKDTPGGGGGGGGLSIAVVGSGPAPHDGPGSVVMTARLQQRIEAVADPNLGWGPVPGAHTETTLEPRRTPDGTVWEGDLRLPPERRGQELRVVVEEWQIVPAGVEGEESSRGGRGGDSSGRQQDPAPQRRLVYRDTIPVARRADEDEDEDERR